MTQKLNNADILGIDAELGANVEQVVGLYSRCLRDYIVQDKIKALPKDAPYRNQMVEFATRVKANSLSYLSLSLIFGMGSPRTCWAALRNGTKDKVLFARAVKNFIRAFGQNSKRNIAHHPTWILPLRENPEILEQVDQAERHFFEVIFHELLATIVERLAKFVPQGIGGEDTMDRIRNEFSYEQVKHIKPIECGLPEMRLSPALAASGYLIEHYPRGSGLWSPAVSAALVCEGRSWSAVPLFHPAPFRASDRRIGWRKILKAEHDGDWAFNSRKMALRSDILVVDDKLPAQILLQRCEYVDTISTNDVASHKVYEEKSRPDGTVDPDSLLLIGADLFLAADGTLLGYAETQCANQLGVSTLAITDDGVPILIIQLEKNLQSKNLFAPSGSGSLDDPLDFLGLQSGQSWADWLQFISERELREELGVQAHKTVPPADADWMNNLKLKTLPVGFGGLLHRGGKPDFFFLARISCTVEELVERSCYSAVEKSLSALIVDLKDFDRVGSSAASLRKFCERERRLRADRTSVPLAMLFNMLIYVATDLEDKIDAFLGEPW